MEENKCERCNAIFIDEANAFPLCPECLAIEVRHIIEQLGCSLFLDEEIGIVYMINGTNN